MELKRPLPPDRTYEQLLNHFLVERELASQLKASVRADRSEILNWMYEELFRRVPDHPRLVRRQDQSRSDANTKAKMALVRRFLDGVHDFLEFAPGDCRFASAMAAVVANVYGVDISDQRDPDDVVPDGFHFIVYDGFRCTELAPQSIDLVFSDQLIEHIHPDDVQAHFELAWNLLRPGGKYVFRMPHAYTGPHDISRYFSDHPVGFHLKEWTYTEIVPLIRRAGFTSVHCLRFSKGQSLRVPYPYISLVEWALSNLAPRVKRRLARWFVSSSVYAAAVK